MNYTSKFAIGFDLTNNNRFSSRTYSFGAKIRSRVLGFMYNNELADFSEFWPQIYNLTKDEKTPGKRPISRSMPTIFVKDKQVQGVFGAAGGAFIPTCMATVSFFFFFWLEYFKELFPYLLFANLISRFLILLILIMKSNHI